MNVRLVLKNLLLQLVVLLGSQSESITVQILFIFQVEFFYPLKSLKLLFRFATACLDFQQNVIINSFLSKQAIIRHAIRQRPTRLQLYQHTWMRRYYFNRDNQLHSARLMFSVRVILKNATNRHIFITTTASTLTATTTTTIIMPLTEF